MVDKVRLALLAMQRHSWEQGVAMQALLEMGDTQTVILLAKEAAYRSMADGRVATIGVTDGVTDPCCAGEALLYAARLTMDRDLLAASQKLEHWALDMAPRSESGIVYHLTTRPEFWVDSMYMLPPYLAAAGHFTEAAHQLMGYYEALHDERSGLMCHMWDDKNRCFIRAAHWGVGNGWAVSGMARVIALLPDSRKDAKNNIIRMATALIDSLLLNMREDGLFHDVVDDPGTFVETNLSQMLAYTLLRGISDGWLAHEKYIAHCEKLRAAVIKKVDAYGLVQGVCGAPTFDKPGVAPEGQAFFLLMEAVYRKLGKTLK
jgi:rhamnogalacturonyl hydrolase YesR